MTKEQALKAYFTNQGFLTHEQRELIEQFVDDAVELDEPAISLVEDSDIELEDDQLAAGTLSAQELSALQAAPARPINFGDVIYQLINSNESSYVYLSYYEDEFEVLIINASTGQWYITALENGGEIPTFILESDGTEVADKDGYFAQVIDYGALDDDLMAEIMQAMTSTDASTPNLNVTFIFFDSSTVLAFRPNRIDNAHVYASASTDTGRVDLLINMSNGTWLVGYPIPAVQQVVLETNLVDSDGNLRFLKISPSSTSDYITLTYGAAVLNGYELNVVVDGIITSDLCSVTGSFELCQFVLPSYVYSQLVAKWSNIVTKQRVLITSEPTGTVLLEADSGISVLRLEGSNTIGVRLSSGSLDYSSTNGYFRVHFSLIV